LHTTWHAEELIEAEQRDLLDGDVEDLRDLLAAF
jgi:hypothetical protein